MIITGNERVSLKSKTVGPYGDRYIIYLSGNLGSATATLQYKDELGTFVPLEDGVLLINSQNRIEPGREANLYLHVTGADGATNIAVTLRSLS
ncbi:MAG: hypothetical protein HRU18_02845 [Pseudoalteromonas sp.]|uniref:hypothetical protein n=1 Tax=Pseudoalteromonas sp. TaxID=53249 RepID=UPI001D95C3EB|nr:hypothetical protein [Pseudoalteromonas sp.]NRA77122.1 hypothetical protein [Pseudoalteromonas sp.]